ncbi:hypothetical protein Y032_1158g3711, partial [Ancylostoma ceylanicum]
MLPRGGVYCYGKLMPSKKIQQITLGLSPSFTFVTGCFFYAINVTYMDESSSFFSTDETCYD